MRPFARQPQTGSNFGEASRPDSSGWTIQSSPSPSRSRLAPQPVDLRARSAAPRPGRRRRSARPRRAAAAGSSRSARAPRWRRCRRARRGQRDVAAPEDRVADEAVRPLRRQQALQLGPRPRRLEAAPDDRREAGVPVPLPGVAAGARLGVAEAGLAAAARRPSSAAAPARSRRGPPRRVADAFRHSVRRISRSASAPSTASRPGQRQQPRPGVGPGDAADEPLPRRFDHVGHRVDFGDLLQPGLQQRQRRVGGGEQDQRHHPRLHQRRRRLALEVQRQHRAPAGGDGGHRGDHQVADRPARRGRAIRRRSRSAIAEHEGRRDQRAGAGREHVAGQQDPARGGGDEQAVDPALFVVAGQVDPGRGAGEAGPLQHADRDDEALVGAGFEALQLGQRAEDAVEAEEEDRRRQHPWDRRPRHPHQLVLRPRHQRGDRRQVGAPCRRSRRVPAFSPPACCQLHQPTRSRCSQGAGAEHQAEDDDAGDRRHRLQRSGRRRSRR